MASKTYEIAFNIASKLSGGFAKSFSTANKTINKLNSELTEFNTKIAAVDKVYAMRKEVGQAARAYKDAGQKATELGNNFAKAEQKTERLRQEFLQSKTETERLKNTIKGVKNPSSELTRAFENSRIKTSMLSNALKDAESETKKLGVEFNGARSATNKAENALNKKRTALHEFERTAGTTGMRIKQLIQHKKDLAAQADKARASIDKLTAAGERIEKISNIQSKWNAQMTSSAIALGKMAVAAKGFYSVIMEPSMALQDVMADVRKVTDATDAELAGFTRQVEEISLRTPVAAEGLGEIMAAAAQANVAKKDLGEFTERASQMAIAFDITAEESGTMMAKWQSGMKLSMKDVYALGDAVNELSNKNAALAAEVGEVLKRYGAMGDISGLSPKETAAFGATIIASGVAPDIAATSMKAFMRNLAKGGSMIDRQKAAFKFSGLNPKQIQEDLQKNGPETIVKTLEAIQKNVPQKRWNQYLSDMFGDRAMQSIGPMMKNIELLKKNFKLVANEANYAGSMYKEYQTRCKTASNATQLLKNALSYAARSIGGPLLEPMREWALALGEMSAKLGNLLRENPEFVRNVILLGAGFMGVSAAIHAVTLVVGFALKPWLKLAKGIAYVFQTVAAYKAGAALTKGQRLLVGFGKACVWIGAKLLWLGKCVLGACKVLALLVVAHPIIAAIVVAIGLLVAAGIWLYKNWDMVKAKAVELWIAMKETWQGICIIASETWNSVKSWVLSAWDAIVTATVSAFGAVVNWFVSLKNKAVELFQTFLQNFPIIGSIIRIVGAVIQFVIQLAINNFKLWRAAGIALWNGIKWCWEGIKSVTISCWNAVKSWVSSTWDSVASVTVSVCNAVKGWVSAGWNWVKSATISLWQKIVSCWNAIKAATISAWNTITQPLIAAWNKLKEFGAFVWGKFKSGFISAFQGIRDRVSSIFSGLVGIVKKPMNAVISLVNRAIGGINKINVKIPEWAGGGKLGFNISKIPQLAKGGVATGATLAMVGEGREPEAIIPLSKLDSMLGRGKGGNEIVINFQPVINISGDGGNVTNDVQRGLRLSQETLKRELEKLLRNERRLSFT